MSKKKIQKLSDEKWAEVYALRERYRAIGLCTEPADRVTTEEVIGDFYTRIGKEKPRFIWLDGPASVILGWNLLRILFKDSKELGSQLYSQLCSQLDSQLYSQLCSQLDSQLRSQLYSQLYSQLGSQLYSQLYSQLDSQLRSQKIEMPSMFWGAEGLSWIAYYLGGELAGAKYDAASRELLGQWERLYRSSGWWLPCEGWCFVAERHLKVSFDEQRRLHNERGAAIECRDGATLYAWHGTRVPGEWIDQKDKIDPGLALTHKNIEQRRAFAEIIGWKHVLERVPTRVIDKDKDPMVGTLLECDLPGSENSRFLRVLCATGREFVLSVPREMETALSANAWTWGLEAEQYRPEVQT